MPNLLNFFIFVSKLVFCRALPNKDQAKVCKFQTDRDEDLVDSFPELKLASGVHLKGRKYVAINSNPLGMAPTSKKHGNKKKKEKLRRVYNESPYA